MCVCPEYKLLTLSNSLYHVGNLPLGFQLLLEVCLFVYQSYPTPLQISMAIWLSYFTITVLQILQSVYLCRRVIYQTWGTSVAIRFVYQSERTLVVKHPQVLRQGEHFYHVSHLNSVFSRPRQSLFLKERQSISLPEWACLFAGVICVPQWSTFDQFFFRRVVFEWIRCSYKWFDEVGHDEVVSIVDGSITIWELSYCIIPDTYGCFRK